MNTDTLIRVVGDDLLIGSSRVSVENIVIAHQQGETPEQIQENFPSLSLPQVYGALVYYLEHQSALDERFAERQRHLDALDVENRAAHAEFFDTMDARFRERKANQTASKPVNECRSSDASEAPAQ
ncbi:MAG TPA: DUF433 domain-containing protein [Ktedonobacterales bacterium]|nr:DUF433 domain-containing protein [Ktedonobacterales bacterium]